MPKQKEYEGAVDSIFSFIFANNKGKSRKIQYKPTGMSGSDEMTRALAELAAKPATLIADEGLNMINSTFLNSKIFEFRLDKGDDLARTNPRFDADAGRIRVRASDVAKIANDPNAFVDKIYAKAKQERALSKMFLPAVGMALDQAVSIGYAKKNGMSTSDALRFSKTTSINVDAQTRRMNKELIAGNAVMNSEMKRIAERMKTEALQSGKYGGDPKSDVFMRAVHDELAKHKADIDKKSQYLSNVVNSSHGMKHVDFTGKYIDINKEFPGLSFTEDTKKLEDLLKEKYKVDPKKTDIPDLINNMRASNSFDKKREALVSDLQKRYKVDEAEARSWITGMQDELASNVGGGMSTYRTNMYKNLDYKAAYASSQSERDALHSQKAVILGWERIKGSKETISASNINTSLSKLRAARDADPTNKAKYDAIEKQLIDLKEQAGRVSSYSGITQSANAARDDAKLNTEIMSAQLKAEALSLNKEIADAHRSGDHFRASLLEAQKKQLESMGNGVRGVPGSEWRYRLANLDGLQASVRSMTLQGGLGAALVNGTFFYEQASGLTAPGTMSNLSFQEGFHQKLDDDGKVELGKDGKPIIIATDKFGVGGSSYYKDSRGPSFVGQREFVPRGYGELVSLYYFTPGSMLKTVFFNGEGFNYMAHRRLQGLQGQIATNKDALFSALSGFSKEDLAKVGLKPGFSADDLQGNYLATIELLKQKADAGQLSPELQKLLKALEGKYGAAARLSRISGFYHRINLAKRIENFGAGIKAALWEKTGLRVGAENILKLLGKSDLWKQKVGELFAGKIGVRQLVQAGLSSVTSALAAAFGPIGSALAWVATSMLTEVVIKITKPFMQILMGAMVGLLILLCAIPFLFETFVLKRNVAAANTPPGVAQICGVEIYPGDPVDPPPGTGSGIPPADAICPVNTGATCNQGPSGQWSHAKMGTLATDLGVNAGLWKAPSDGTVTQSVANRDCEWDPGNSRGGQMMFTDSSGNTYRILHIDPLVGTGPVTQGTVLGRMSTGLPRSLCWTGAHYHVEVSSGGGYVNSLQWYNQLSCGIQGC